MKSLNFSIRKVKMDNTTIKKKKLFRKNQSGVVDALYQYYPDLAKIICMDSFANKAIIKGKAPWDKVEDRRGYREWHNSDILTLTVALQNMGVDITKDMVHDAIYYIAVRNKVNPLVEKLDSLVDDGRNLLDDWLITHAKAKGNKTYLRSIGPKFLISAVARAYEPGCKVDSMLVLEGEQGIGKSELLRILAIEDDWFTDCVDDITNKDTYSIIQGKWIIEIPELDAFKHARQTKLKAFISRQFDVYRKPYERIASAIPRCCVFTGSTNENEYSKDETGARRNWPVNCADKIDLDNLRRDVLQLWAEAVRRYKNGEKWYLTEPIEILLAQNEQHKRLEKDPWEDALIKAIEKKFMDDEPIVSIEDLLLGDGSDDNEGFHFSIAGIGKAERNRVKACLTGTQKYQYTRLRVDNKRVYGFVRKLSNTSES